MKGSTQFRHSYNFELPRDTQLTSQGEVIFRGVVEFEVHQKYAIENVWSFIVCYILVAL